MSRRKLTDEELIKAIQEYLDGKGGYKVISPKYGINIDSFRKFVKEAQKEGIPSVRKRERNKKYSTELKIKAVEAVLAGHSQMDVFKICFSDCMSRAVFLSETCMIATSVSRSHRLSFIFQHNFLHFIATDWTIQHT